MNALTTRPRDVSAVHLDGLRQDFRELLERARVGLLEQVAGLVEQLAQVDVEPESCVHWHAERALLVGRIALGREDVAELERQLQRLSDRRFGRSEHCGT